MGIVDTVCGILKCGRDEVQEVKVWLIFGPVVAQCCQASTLTADLSDFLFLSAHLTQMSDVYRPE